MKQALNKVIAGDFESMYVKNSLLGPYIDTDYKDPLYLDSETIENYERISEDHQKSVGDTIYYSALGGILFGAAGAIVGGLSAGNKNIYHLALYFHDGKKSLLEIDDKLYNAIIRNCF